MFALITPDNRSPLTTEAGKASAFDRMLAYSGPYRIELPNRLITTVDISWYEPWVGTEQVRSFELHGDELQLRSAPLHMPQGGTALFAVVTWRRERIAR